MRYRLSLIICMLALCNWMTSCSSDDPIIDNPKPTPDVPVTPDKENTTHTDPIDPDTVPAQTGELVAVMRISTLNHRAITSKDEYVACHIVIEGQGIYANYETPEITANKNGKLETDSIRGRGNSTWEWYDKKPYKIKLGKKESLLGIPKGEKYVLLANYRDPSRQMNAVSFDMARFLGLPYSNTNRFVEVFLNDRYIGLYQLTEQIERGTGRVDIDKEKGILLALDYDDGPTEAPYTGNNFLSNVFHSSYSPKGLPVCVKYPKHPDTNQLTTIRYEFAELEQTIKNLDYEGLKKICDLQTMIDFLIIQEITRNVELVTPRSMYMFRNADGIWKFGPVWDFDGGFAYDWQERHGYFGSQSWLMGPKGDYDIPDFYDRMFDNEQFLADYKARWHDKGKAMVNYAISEMSLRLDSLNNAINRDEQCWPMNKKCSTECNRLSSWLIKRANDYTEYLNTY